MSKLPGSTMLSFALEDEGESECGHEPRIWLPLLP